MAWTFLDSTAAATYAAADPYQATKIAALLAPWDDGADDVIARIYDGATLRDTVTLGPWTVEIDPLPRRIACGARLARTHTSAGNYTRIVFCNATDEILQLSVAPGSAQGFGPIKAACPPNLEGVFVEVDANLLPVPPLALTQIIADAMWTWFTEERALWLDDKLWASIITEDGRPAITTYDPNTDTEDEFRLVTGTFETDDHNNPGLVVTPGGKVGGFYSKHNGDDFARFRFTSAALDNSAYDTEVAYDAGGLVAYSNPHYLSVPNRYYSHYRLGLQSQHAISIAADLTTVTDEGEWIVNGAQRPYVKSCSNGTDTIFFFFTAGHPNQVDGNSVYAIKAVFASDGSREFRRLNNDVINTTGSITPAQATLVWDGSTADGEAWTWQVALGDDGHPRFLFARFPDPASDHRYMHARWTGSAIVVNEITDAGTPLYIAETYYTRGICFDANDVKKLCLVKDVSGVGEAQEWRTSDESSWSKYRDITTGTSAGVSWMRPVSPKGHDGTIQFVLLRGDPYGTFTDWSASAYGVGAA